jgi:116 kDa U5 small nuclear ribonucleoprotein component
MGRILSGTITVGDSVNVLGEGYTLEDDEDMSTQRVSGVSFFQCRYRIEFESLCAGNWVLLEGVDASILKTATITQHRGAEDAYAVSLLT